MRFSVALATLLLVLASGCQDSAPKVIEASSAPAGEVALTGWVLSTDSSPLSNASVALLGLNASVNTDGQGRYAFPTVPIDGTSLVVIAEAEGHKPLSQSVTPAADETTVLNFTLEPIPVKVPYYETLEDNGLISCQAYLEVLEEPRTFDCGGTDPQNDVLWEFTVEPDLAGVVIELQWEPTTSASEQLNITVETIGYGDSNEVLAAQSGPSTLTVRVNSLQAERYYSKGGTIRVTVGAGADIDADESQAGGSVPFQQGFHTAATMFYVAPPPPTFTALR